MSSRRRARPPLRVLDLFSGIGGFALGLERTGGFRTVAFCEVEPFPRAVLAAHWPGVPIYHDVERLTAAELAADGIAVDVLCGGFPCQDVSFAGNGGGIGGARSGLWFHMHRLIGELRPRWVIAENVSALRTRGLETVLRSLAALGYDAEWHCVPAAALGAPHRRDRIWIIAHPNGERRGWLEPERLEARRDPELARHGAHRPMDDARGERWHAGRQDHAGDERLEPRPTGQDARAVADTARERWPEARRDRSDQSAQRPAGGGAVGADMADTHGEPRQQGRQDHAAQGTRRRHADRGGGVAHVPHPDLPRPQERQGLGLHHGEELAPVVRGGWQRNRWWSVEPGLGRVAHGIPNRVDRLTALGNAIVPQIAEELGREILEAERRRRRRRR